MTPHESRDLEVLMVVRDTFTKPVTPGIFRDVMGHVRDAIKRLQYLKEGCPTGTHAYECTCKANVVGLSVSTIKEYRRLGRNRGNK